MTNDIARPARESNTGNEILYIAIELIVDTLDAEVAYPESKKPSLANRPISGSSLEHKLAEDVGAEYHRFTRLVGGGIPSHAVVQNLLEAVTSSWVTRPSFTKGSLILKSGAVGESAIVGLLSKIIAARTILPTSLHTSGLTCRGVAVSLVHVAIDSTAKTVRRSIQLGISTTHHNASDAQSRHDGASRSVSCCLVTQCRLALGGEAV